MEWYGLMEHLGRTATIIQLAEIVHAGPVSESHTKDKLTLEMLRYTRHLEQKKS